MCLQYAACFGFYIFVQIMIEDIPVFQDGKCLLFVTRMRYALLYYNDCSNEYFVLKIRVNLLLTINYIASCLTRFNKIATQGAHHMAVDKEANSLSRVYSYYSKFNLRLFYV